MSRLRLLIGSRTPARSRGALRATVGATHVEVVAHAREGSEVLRKARELRPDIVLVHVDLSGTEVLTPARMLAVAQARALLLCLHPSSTQSSTPVLATLCTFVLGTTDLETVARVLDENHARRCPYAGGRRPSASQPRDSLTPREREVLGHVACEKTSREIGVELGISPRTVDAHRSNVMKKLNIHTVAGLTRYALERGILDPDSRL